MEQEFELLNKQLPSKFYHSLFVNLVGYKQGVGGNPIMICNTLGSAPKMIEVTWKEKTKEGQKITNPILRYSDKSGQHYADPNLGVTMRLDSVYLNEKGECTVGYLKKVCDQTADNVTSALTLKGSLRPVTGKGFAAIDIDTQIVMPLESPSDLVAILNNLVDRVVPLLQQHRCERSNLLIMVSPKNSSPLSIRIAPIDNGDGTFRYPARSDVSRLIASNSELSEIYKKLGAQNYSGIKANLGFQLIAASKFIQESKEYAFARESMLSVFKTKKGDEIVERELYGFGLLNITLWNGVVFGVKRVDSEPTFLNCSPDSKGARIEKVVKADLKTSRSDILSADDAIAAAFGATPASANSAPNNAQKAMASMPSEMVYQSDPRYAGSESGGYNATNYDDYAQLESKPFQSAQSGADALNQLMNTPIKAKHAQIMVP